MTTSANGPLPPRRLPSGPLLPRPRGVLLGVVALGLAFCLVVGAPAPASPQVRPEAGGSLGGAAGFDGDALVDLESDLVLGLEAGLSVADAWRFTVLSRWSSHATEDSFIPDGADLWTLAGELVWRPPTPEWRVRPHLGVRAGLARVDYDVSNLALLEIDLVPGARVVEDDAGPYLGPVAGLRLPVAGRFALELDGVYGFYDVDPVIVGPEGEPGWSRGVSVEATVVASL